MTGIILIGIAVLVVFLYIFSTDNMIIHVVYDDGITNSYRKDRKDIKKTGKHIDIQSILEQIGGE